MILRHVPTQFIDHLGCMNHLSRSTIFSPSYTFGYRAADLLQIDEAYMRHRNEEEIHLLPEKNGPITEELQLVHYDIGQQYTP